MIPFKKQYKNDLKKKSKKELIKLCMFHLENNANLTNQLEISENDSNENIQSLHTTLKALESAENALIYKEGEIDHKDRLLKSLIQS